MQKNPGTSLKIVSCGTEDMFRLLDHNEVDAILTLESHIYDTEYVIVREEKVANHFVVSAASPLAKSGKFSLEELIRQPFILTEKGMSYRRMLDEKLAAHSLEIQPVFVSGNAGLIASLVEQNAGLALLPDYITKPYIEKGALCYLNVPEMEIEIWTQLLHHREKWVSEPMRIVIDHLRRCML